MYSLPEYWTTVSSNIENWMEPYDPDGFWTKVTVAVISMFICWLVTNCCIFTGKRSFNLSKKMVVGVFRFLKPLPAPLPEPDPQIAALDHCLDDPETIWDAEKMELLADQLYVKFGLYAGNVRYIVSAITDAGKGEDIMDDLEPKEKEWLLNRCNQVISDILKREKRERRLVRASKLTYPVVKLSNKQPCKTPVVYEPVITETLRKLKKT